MSIQSISPYLDEQATMIVYAITDQRDAKVRAESALCEDFLRLLCPREKKFVQAHFMDGQTYQQIASGEQERISIERVRQIIAPALMKLQRHAERTRDAVSNLQASRREGEL